MGLVAEGESVGVLVAGEAVVDVGRLGGRLSEVIILLDGGEL